MAHTSNQPDHEQESVSTSATSDNVPLATKIPKARRPPKDRKPTAKIGSALDWPPKAPSTSNAASTSEVQIPVGRPIRSAEEREAVNRALEKRIKKQEAQLQLESMRAQAKEFRRTKNRRNTETEDLIARQQQESRQRAFGKGKAGTRLRAPTKFYGSAVDSQKAIAKSPRKNIPKKKPGIDSELTEYAKRMTSKLEVMSLSQLQDEEGAETSFEQSSPEKSSPEKSPDKN